MRQYRFASPRLILKRQLTPARDLTVQEFFCFGTFPFSSVDQKSELGFQSQSIKWRWTPVINPRACKKC